MGKQILSAEFKTPWFVYFIYSKDFTFYLLIELSALRWQHFQQFCTSSLQNLTNNLDFNSCELRTAKILNYLNVYTAIKFYRFSGIWILLWKHKSFWIHLVNYNVLLRRIFEQFYFCNYELRRDFIRRGTNTNLWHRVL